MRAVLAVIGGYVALFLFIFVTFSIAYLLLGASGAFKPGSFEPSLAWIVVSFVLGFVGAVVGGWACAAIARTQGPVTALAGLVLVLGLVLAGFAAMAPDEGPPPARTGDTDNFEAMQNAQQPLWVAFLNPFVGAAGVVVGGRLKKTG